ncbi:hypothetical protein QQ045_010371 [Rhodiola kirilowii]
MSSSALMIALPEANIVVAIRVSKIVVGCCFDGGGSSDSCFDNIKGFEVQDVISMKINAAQRVRKGGPRYTPLGDFKSNHQRRSARKIVICKYWVAGCCKNDQCKFSHGDLPPQYTGYQNVKYNSAPKKWSRDMNPSQKKTSYARVNVPSKIKPITPLKSELTNPAKQRIITLLKREAALTTTQKKNVSAAFSNTMSPNSQMKIIHEKLDNKRTTLNSQMEIVHEKVDSKATTPNSQGEILPQEVERVCEQWVLGNCADAEKCRYLHSWFRGDGFTRVALLEGHNKAISGIALPSGSDKLYSASIDGTLCHWNCHTGQCADVVHLEGEIGSLACEGPWLFVGIPNSILAKNIETSAEFALRGVVGKVHSVIVASDVIFAGAQDGVILVWKTSSESSMLQPSATILGHDKAVVSLAVGGNHLYTGSLDHTVKVWDLNTLECVQTLTGHSDAVMSLLCLDRFLISCSLDRTIKIWAVNGDGKFEVTYTHNEEHGILALAWMNDFESILLCACSDKSVRIYELPSFCDRGRLFSREVVEKIDIGPSGLFFTGDVSGSIAVWSLLGGRDGLTHNMLNDIHNHWVHSEAVRIKCMGVCTVDMENVCNQIEDKTFGKIIHRKGGTLVLYRGRNYVPKKRPVIPLMLWRPHEPIYPRLIKTTIEGLSIEETKVMRKKGLSCLAVTKLSRNGYYGSLILIVRDAFLMDEIVRIDCKGLEKSDYKKIGMKLRDLVPCVLVTFDKEQIVVWRGKNYKPDGAGHFLFGKDSLNNPDSKLCDSLTVADISADDESHKSCSESDS